MEEDNGGGIGETDSSALDSASSEASEKQSGESSEGIRITSGKLTFTVYQHTGVGEVGEHKEHAKN